MDVQSKWSSGVSVAMIAASMLAQSAYAQEATRRYDIPAGDVAAALKLFAEQADANVLFDPGLVQSERTEGLRGEYSRSDALAALLLGTRLTSRHQNGTIVIAVADLPLPSGGSTQGPFDAEGDRVVVTGTLLRGLAPESSPVQFYDREDILASGVATTEQFMRTLPQNFGGGSSEFAPSGLPGDNSSTFNNTFGSGANLRGLGSGATLTLLNGRRLAPTSRIGDFVDLSMIPLSALERVDILTDGASSIYGGDAVAGVVNFVLRDDFEGAEASARYGAATSGGLQEYKSSVTLGAGWNTGNLLGTYEYAFRDNLTLAERPEIPVLTLNNGQPIADPSLFDLMPKQMRHSAILAANQEVGASLRLSATGAFSDKSVTSVTVLPSSSESLFIFDVNSELRSLSVGAEYDLSPDWTLSFDANSSQIRNEDSYLTESAGGVRSTGGRITHSDLWSADLLLSGDLFQLPAGPVRSAIGGHFRKQEFRNENVGIGADKDGAREIGALFGEVLVPLYGSANALPGVKRLEINVSARLDDYSDFGSTTNPKVGILWSPADGLSVRGTYSTSFTPPPLGRTGDLERSGGVIPFSFLGLILGGLPSPDPSLDTVDMLLASGTAANLDPETSQTYTFGLDYRGSYGSHRWSGGLGFYDIAFKGRLSQTPIPQNQPAALAPYLAWDDPGSFPEGTVIFFPTQQEVDAYIAALGRPPSFIGGASNYNNIGIINNAGLVRNLANTMTSGVDFNIDYAVETDIGELALGFNANHILTFKQQAAANTPVVDALNSLLNPVDFRVRGHVGLSTGAFTGNLFLNYVDSYKTDQTSTALPISSWTTVDLTLGYQFEESAWDFLNGSRLNFSVSNLFDEPPPATPSIRSARIAGYDPTNASPLLRLVALEFSKSF